jgi:hypothetical protein
MKRFEQPHIHDQIQLRISELETHGLAIQQD